jgi:hypothetical protein
MRCAVGSLPLHPLRRLLVVLLRPFEAMALPISRSERSTVSLM